MEAGDIKLNLGPDTINSSLFIYTAILEVLEVRLYNRELFRVQHIMLHGISARC